ncbi:MAG: 6-phosphogluconolactonase [Sphingobacteriaceae bacterium]|nr:6-phosphogluconolactonase [Cytophagaceae bacterium]
MHLHPYPTPASLTRAVADWLVAYSAEVLAKQARFTIALSGGSTPQALYELLATEEFRRKIAWESWHVFWGDERGVSFNDERSNARMAFHALLDYVPVPSSQIHVLRTDNLPKLVARDYEALLHTYFDNQTTTFDLVLLGLGEDGHTLSLFPGTDVVNEERAWVRAVYLDSQEMNRLTLTAPLVNRAACVAFLVTGAKKAPVLKEVLEGIYQPEKYPSQRIQPLNGNLHWFVDEAAKPD